MLDGVQSGPPLAAKVTRMRVDGAARGEPPGVSGGAERGSAPPSLPAQAKPLGGKPCLPQGGWKTKARASGEGSRGGKGDVGRARARVRLGEGVRNMGRRRI